MNRAIIVSVPSERTGLTEQTVKNMGFGQTAVFSAGSELRRAVKSGSLDSTDLIIIFAPLSDEYGDELAETAAEETAAGIVFVCGGDYAEELRRSLEPAGIEVLTNPLSRESLSDAVRRVTGRGQLPESADVMSRIDDIRLINKAKTVLMKYLKFTEPQAHRYIEKQAMNSRCTRREAAEKIISSYK